MNSVYSHNQNRIIHFSCNVFIHILLHGCIVVYCMFNHSILNILIVLILFLDTVNLKNVNEYASTSLPSIIKQGSVQTTNTSNTHRRKSLDRRYSFSAASIGNAYEKVSLQDDASYSTWILLFPNMTIRSFLYDCLCLLLLIRHFFLLFSEKTLNDSSSFIHHVIYLLNGGHSNASILFYEYFLMLAVCVLNHVFDFIVFNV